MAIYTSVGALLLPITLRRMPSLKSTIIAQRLLYLPAVVLIPVFTGWLMIVVVILMTFGESTSYLIWESLIGKTATGYKNVATSIGFLHVPSNLVLIPSFIFAGLLIHEFGYIAPFWIARVFFLIYSIGAWRLLKSRDN